MDNKMVIGGVLVVGILYLLNKAQIDAVIANYMKPQPTAAELAASAAAKQKADADAAAALAAQQKAAADAAALVAADAQKKAADAAALLAKQAATPAVINWKESQSSAPYLETNLKIIVDGTEQVMEWFNNSGSFNVTDGALINIAVITQQSDPSSAWQASGTNNLTVTDNGASICNKVQNNQGEFGFSFVATGGHTYNVKNYTIPS